MGGGGSGARVCILNLRARCTHVYVCVCASVSGWHQVRGLRVVHVRAVEVALGRAPSISLDGDCGCSNMHLLRAAAHVWARRVERET